MQAVSRIYYSAQEGKGCTLSWDSLSPSPSSLEATLKERIYSFGEQIFSFKSDPQIWSDNLSTIKVKNKNDFFYLSEDMENCKMSGKIREKSGNCEVDDKWQPWYMDIDHLPLYPFRSRLFPSKTRLFPSKTRTFKMNDGQIKLRLKTHWPMSVNKSFSVIKLSRQLRLK